jgi:hypothetical protein
MADHIDSAVLDIFTDAERPIHERLADAVKAASSLAPKGSSFSLEVHFHEWNSEPHVACKLHGKWGVEIAKALGVVPGNWYGFESLYKGESRGTPQRSYNWILHGVEFTCIESTRDCGVSFEEAAAQQASDPDHPAHDFVNLDESVALNN